MASYTRPGVFVEETLRTRNPDPSSNTSVAVFISAHGRGPTDPHLVRSWSDFGRVFGGFHDHTPPSQLPYAVFQFFNNGGREAYVLRVTGADGAVSTASFNDRDATAPAETLVVESVNIGAWGDDVYIGIEDSGDRFNLIVYYRGTSAMHVVERFTDLSMDPASGEYVETKVNSPITGSSYISVHDANSANQDTIGYDGVRPAETEGTPTQLAGGDNGTAPTTTELTDALEKLETINRAYVLNYPGVTDDAVINAALTHVEGTGKGFVIADTPVGLDAQGAADYGATLQASSHGAVYYPYLTITDPGANSQGATKLVPPGGAIAGIFASTDAARGVWKAPAGLATRVAGAASTELRLTSDDLELLNSGHVNAIRHAPGVGFVVWGARTLKRTQADKYVPIRRTLIYLKQNLKEATEWAVFEPNDETLWASLEATVENFLTGFWQEGGLRGAAPNEAFYVKSDAELNSQSAVESGIVNVEVGVALQYPAEFVVIKLSQWEGGASTTDSVTA